MEGCGQWRGVGNGGVRLGLRAMGAAWSVGPLGSGSSTASAEHGSAPRLVLACRTGAARGGCTWAGWRSNWRRRVGSAWHGGCKQWRSWRGMMWWSTAQVGAPVGTAREAGQLQARLFQSRQRQ